MQNITFKKTLVAMCVLTFLAPAWAGDSERIKALEQKLDQSMATIVAMQKRLDELEHKGDSAPAPAAVVGAATPAPAASSSAGIDARVEAIEHSVAQIEASSAAAAQVDTGLPIHGFADVKLGDRNSAAASLEKRGYRGVDVGTFDLYMTPQISSQVKALVELAFEYDDSGELEVDAERMQLGYVFSDSLTVWAGRFHTPYGYWNTAFHHGAQIQTALTRPQFLDFEDSGGILPAHSVGLWLTGARDTGLGRVGYDFTLVNGDRLDNGQLDFQAIGDGDSNVGLGFRTNLAVAGTGLTLGLHGLSQKIAGGNALGTASGRVQLNMLGGYATYENDDWEAMAEYYGFRNADLSGGTGRHASTAWYAQIGYNVNDQFTPYARYEDADLNSRDPYFNLQQFGQAYRRGVLGIRYNLTPKSALKAEVMRGTQVGTPGTPSSLQFQYAIRF
ncbi:MAG: hypothetical protein JSR59_16590 [Proteobacteria bacterium]|nr:hypothetical protein [Pseudomonadota bacterium]